MESGLIVIDKPAGVTSRDVVNRVQRVLPRRTRLGHTGTLDPLATGVLVLCIGKATRLAEYVQAMPKTYHAVIGLGATSTTDDADGIITRRADAVIPDAAMVARWLREFIGAIEQTPPAYSAVKIDGRRAYDLARQGHEIELRARLVRIYNIEILRYEYPVLEIEVHCGRGTYIRSLARDLGDRLGCGGYIEALRRTRVGHFDATAGIAMERINHSLREKLLPIESAVADLARVDLNAEDSRRFAQGQIIACGAEIRDGEYAVFSGGELIGVGAGAAGVLRPVLVLRTD